MKVLITGGSGLLGSSLTKKLVSEKIEVVHLTREKSSKNDVKNYIWDWRNKEIDERCFNGVTHIVHLAGAGIAEKAWRMEGRRPRRVFGQDQAGRISVSLSSVRVDDPIVVPLA